MKKLFTIVLLMLHASLMRAQITIGGNVYGGGNAGDVKGRSSVTVYDGDLNSVFGGARQANVEGSALVSIDGAHMSGNIVIDYIYGGNDIAGTIGSTAAMPTTLIQAEANGIDDTFNAFVQTTAERKVTDGDGTTQPYSIFIGQLYGGGNGDYNYTSPTLADGTTPNPYYGKEAPVLAKAYLEILGGTIGHTYGGGNSATVTDNTTICIDNSSDVTTTILDADGAEKLTDERITKMGLNTAFTYVESPDFQFARVFGGNNKVPMSIRPTWRLKSGKIRDLYSGGNLGPMTYPGGILLVLGSEHLKIDNVYGGCRMADVVPGSAIDQWENGTTWDGIDYRFPPGYAAKLIVEKGDVNNVYGGNDVSGIVYGGNAVGIHCSIRGNIYGGGNGSYPYTDNAELKNVPLYSDFYYDVNALLDKSADYAFSGKESAEALNKFRPNAEQVSIRLLGSETSPTIINGSVYCGGNSATLNITQNDRNKKAELKVGSYVWANQVFLGSNGENLVADAMLQQYNGTVTVGGVAHDFSRIDMTNADQFATYMDAVSVGIKPTVVFDTAADGEEYIPFSTMFGSLYCGGNRGSMTYDGLIRLNFDDKVIIFDKVVGGSNNANVAMKAGQNAAYAGGVTGAPDDDGNKLELNLSGLKIQPKRWIDENDKTLGLEWNTVSATTKEAVRPSDLTTGKSTDTDLDRRLMGGNVYGGCYSSGHVNGNVTVNINSSVIDRDRIFDVVALDDNGEEVIDADGQYTITQRNSGVILHEQGMDVLGKALNVFGGGKGADTEIWGSTTINLNRGYAFQVFGGSEEGAIGKKDGEGRYSYDAAYSTYINLSGMKAGVSRARDLTEDIAETEFIYGGGFLGPIAGDTHVYLGNGRIYNSFAGSCNADIEGHTETYVGLTLGGESGFPYVRDNIYGGNDLGGEIKGSADFADRIREDVTDIKTNIHGGSYSTTATTYMEYQQGRIGYIFGGCYGDYDYTEPDFAGIRKPYLDNAFINFRPIVSTSNDVLRLHGSGQGHQGGDDLDKMQNRSYVLVDIPANITTFEDMAVFGAGSWCGLGMRAATPPTAATEVTAYDETVDRHYSAVVDLFRGTVGNVYGGSYNEGFTRRAVVNVPAISTIKVRNLFGGAFGDNPLIPCDVYEAIVNYHSSNATVAKNIYGGNNHADRTLYGQINIDVPVYNGTVDPTTGARLLASVFGAGYGEDTWSQYTEVNLLSGARVYEVYGGGHNGRVLNVESLRKWKTDEADSGNTLDLSMYDYPEDGLDNHLVHPTRLGGKHNCNVHIYRGATVENYAYGGGLGSADIPGSGDVSGTTYIDLLGGTVVKDIYAAGTSGAVRDYLQAKTFTASATAYIEGGTARNVYGGGWRGSVGYHEGGIDSSTAGDIEGETYVIIGKKDGTDFFDGIPAIERNAYGGGEGGAVFGTTHITVHNGYIGYRYHSDWSDDAVTASIDERYEEKIDDETEKEGKLGTLNDSGCVFGGGYIDNSSVDFSNVAMYGGHVRNALFGGGEIAAIGRGVIRASGELNSVRVLEGIYKAGHSRIELFDGHVHRNVFGGGRGYNNLGEGGTLYSDGYVFGQTEVHIHGGEIGTEAGLAQGYGNVFGGGDIGYVYSAYTNANGDLCFGKKSGVRYDSSSDSTGGGDEGYYYCWENGAWKKDGTEKILTEDCQVLVEPHCRVLQAVNIDGHDYAVGDYVPTSALNTMANKNADADRWSKLSDAGIIIHNAVFAGGNTSSGSDKVYANAKTVFGNATATIHDVYHRDLITLGTGHTGGLYGDGNLTFVDGYRGLNITNYGTDYYSIDKEITIDQYHALPAREAAYYELKYKCKVECTDDDGTEYHPADPANPNSKASTLTADDILTLFKYGKNMEGREPVIVDGKPNPYYWTENGVLPVYAGRLMNTIQRADFCGVLGSRMVLQGAQDRVPEIVDYNLYTINRVREVSLNKKISEAGDNPGTKGYEHGNYFGIYNTVNYLGALTSDVDFGDESGAGSTRTTDNTSNDAVAADGKTYYQWKKAHIADRLRNNGSSHNKVALASGVYLELTTEESTGNDLYEKEWGYITGVVELDLINVQTGIGGGFVYAKNVHGRRTATGKTHTTLAKLNRGAVSNKQFTYSLNDSDKNEWQSSGNFVHSTQTIIDDCYNISGKYHTADGVPAHYWYIKGSVYVYDQVISAYTGAPNAYSEQVDIPLTITAASHGTMRLLTVKPNRYAFSKAHDIELGADDKLVINNVTYEKNTPISYWDWYLLSSAERGLFEEETYIVKEDCWIGSTEYKEGQVLNQPTYTSLRNSAPTVVQKRTDDEGNEVVQEVDFDFIFRPSNNVSHDNGYILTYKVNNPTCWDTWYTRADSPTQEKKSTAEYTGEAGYEDGPTYRLKDSEAEGAILGQREYRLGNLIAADVYNTYQTNVLPRVPASEAALQADFERAWVVTEPIVVSEGGVESHLYPGTAVSATEAARPVMAGKVEEAYIATRTIQTGATDYIYLGSRLTLDEKEQQKTDHPELADYIEESIVPAYYCVRDGRYGGNFYEAGHNYRALEAWSSMSPEDREKFTFNGDALDLLTDPASLYTSVQPVDYTASYNADTPQTCKEMTVKRGGTPVTTTSIRKGDELSRVDFESLPNEQRNYTVVDVKEAGPYYVVKTAFQVGNSPYAVGTTISPTTYNSFGDTDKANVMQLDFTNADKGQRYYFCRESYRVAADGGTTVTGIEGKGSPTGTYTAASTEAVPIGLLISDTNYSALVNQQRHFTIHGISPTETSTLYVSRYADIFDLSKEKIYTVIYQYDYEETDVSGNVTPVSERHVVNIHLQFKSGVPSIEDINKPRIVLPGTQLGLREPLVTPGAYEVTGGGWEIFEKLSDAESHINGVEYKPVLEPLYWYQDGYYLAYYAKTYLGKTYSNHQPISVANYHDLKAVLDDKQHHYYIDTPNLTRLGRNPKIYVNDGTNGLQQLKDLYNLSLLDDTSGSAYADHSPLATQVRGAQNLDFILRTNLTAPSGSPAWTPIASSGPCFGGNLHGDGYYISGLPNSLFGNLCGSVYNLGVTGSFATAGIADTGSGYIENCWIQTTGTPDGSTQAVFGQPTGSGTHLVNSYYQRSKNYAAGPATAMADRDFYNGTVAYNLNGFYLNKRYADHATDGDPTTYAYVEDRFRYPDFIYAGGTIPEEDDIRLHTIGEGEEEKEIYIPIWPDDYIYFGQTLSYGYNTARPHQDVPSHIVKTAERLPEDDSNNRVYRAPAYYRSATQGVAHFNPAAMVAQKSSDGQHEAYPDMTAIDFTGYNDIELGYGRGWEDGVFFPPLLDNDGLTRIRNVDETENLLVYSPSEGRTHDVLTNYFVDPVYSEGTYRTVATNTTAVKGHLVSRQGDDYVATTDHLLIDKQDFNCPIAYHFDSGKRMWHQRLPGTYVNPTQGWETVSLPFTAELVTTQTKGEITHFHSLSHSEDGETKIGHEYWLREYKGVKSLDGDVLTTVFNFPEATADSPAKTVDNTFLWDYYYSKNTGQDANADTYQRYYAEPRQMEHYPLFGAATPYIVGFPGRIYYEFDLSGEWTAQHTAAPTPAKIGRQTITFASHPGIGIGVSDDETGGVTIDGYTFMPTYMRQQLTGYVMNVDGNCFKLDTEATAEPFRPYFIAGTPGYAPARKAASSILFDSDDASFAIDDRNPDSQLGDGTLTFSVGSHAITARSTLRRNADVSIYTTNGIRLADFTIHPEEVVETPVTTGGIYIIRADGGRINRKVAIH